MGPGFSQPLAIDGGPRAKASPFPPRRRHGEREKQLLGEVVDSDTLFFWLGTKVLELQRRAAGLYDRKHALACSSGTAAVHVAVGALGLPAGAEVIVPAITDMGSLTGILYQGLVPVFADVDADTLNMDPQAVRALVGPKTAAILAVHHAGLAADLDGLLSVSREAGVPLIEDCAQAWGCQYRGRLAGTFGDIATFSLNHFKHIECGSGGLVVTDDDRLRYRASLFLDKCYQREEGIRNPFFLAPNYQMTELQGAVALAQIEKVEAIAARRSALGSRLNGILAGCPGVFTQPVPAGSRHSYFLYLFRLDLDGLGCTADDFSRALAAEGVPNAARLITGGRPVYLYDIFTRRSAFPGTEYPFAPDRRYRPGDCPAAEAAFDTWITMNIYEEYGDSDVDEIGLAIGKVAWHMTRRASAGVSAGVSAGARR
jgi:dTDP-4-amino-4,6-dideoxygalactose transaminase